MTTVLAIDLGGTRCRIGIAHDADPETVELVEELAAPQSRAAFLDLVNTRIARHGATALGLGIPGLAQGTTCRWVPNLPYLDGLDLDDALPDVSIGLGNDAQLSLLAELHAGAARGLSDAVLLAIGTGIGSAVLASSTIIAGHAGGACSFGWATADLGDPGDAVSGWLERQAAGRALDRHGKALGLVDGQGFVAAARDSHAGAIEALAHPVAALGAAIASAVALLDPAAIIIAGGVAEAFDVLAPLLRPAIDRRLPPHLQGVAVVRAKHGSRAGLVGAAFAGARGPLWRTAQ